MKKTSLNQKPSRLLSRIKLPIIWITFFILLIAEAEAQCLSSVNPVGGTDNLLVLKKNAFRVISFYKYGQGTQYFEGSQHADFNLISKAYYNYGSVILGYGVTDKLTLELETGYFFNKTQKYNVEPGYKLTGSGFSNFVVLAKHSIYTNPAKRIFLTAAVGAKIPSSRNLQYVNHVKLPVEVQPTLGAYGAVFSSSLVKEDSFHGVRYFLTTRAETHLSNKEKYRPGTAVFSSAYVSKHLMFPWLKGDWTAIFQLKNEIRTYDKIDNKRKESSGSLLFFIVPQINYVLHEKWYLSTMVDIPLYQHFNGTQLGAGIGYTMVLSRVFSFNQ
jgi:hypothetical protein